MAYSRDDSIQSIINYKKQWADADAAGDLVGKGNAANYASKEYEKMRNNGDSSIADELSASDYNAALNVQNKWKKTGKTETRPYMYSYMQRYGLTNDQVDNLIGWDGQSGEVTFGGKKIGAPDALVDGSSYWSDTSVLDKAMDEYVTRAGLTLPNSQLAGENSLGVQNKINELWGTQTNDRQMMTDKYGKLEDTAYSNPFTTEEAKAILGKYDLAALQGRDNAVASGSASNGGNIDSYAAASALRQQASLINQGQMAVLDAHNNKINNVKGILSDLGVYLQKQDVGMQNTIGIQQTEAQRLFENDEAQQQRLFENSETAKNNEAARQELYSNISGTVGDKVTKWLNGNIWNEDGSLVNANQDFQAQINTLETALASTTDENERARIQEQLRVLEAARNQKIDEQGLSHGKTYKYQSVQPTELRRQYDAQDLLTRYSIDNGGTSSGSRISSGRSSGSSSSSGSSQLSSNQAQTALKSGIVTQTVLDAYNDHFGTSFTMDNPPVVTEDGRIVAASSVPDADQKTSTQIQSSLNDVYNSSDKTVQNYIRNQLTPLITENSVTESELKNHLINNSSQYDLEVKDIKAICDAVGIDSMWVDDYKNAGWLGGWNSWGSGVVENN